MAKHRIETAVKTFGRIYGVKCLDKCRLTSIISGPT